MKTDGTIYDQLVQPATFGGTAQFYVSQDEYGYLIGDKLYGRIMVHAAQYDEKKVTELADRLADKLQKMGHESGRLITDPNKHFFQDSMDGIFLLLGVLGVLSLILGLLLVYNTINSIISSQTDQIGIMKAIGARTRQYPGLLPDRGVHLWPALAGNFAPVGHPRRLGVLELAGRQFWRRPGIIPDFTTGHHRPECHRLVCAHCWLR